MTRAVAMFTPAVLRSVDFLLTYPKHFVPCLKLPDVESSDSPACPGGQEAGSGTGTLVGRYMIRSPKNDLSRRNRIGDTCLRVTLCQFGALC